MPPTFRDWSGSYVTTKTASRKRTFGCSRGGAGIMTEEVYRAMCRAVSTGIDAPLLVRMRKAAERNIAKYDAKLAAEHAQPFTPELEKHYTGRIKNRRLIEGDCDRPWQNYFAYREAHADASNR
jgi:hypothetical protein